MNVTDFAELQHKYTGANNKRKWVITRPDVLLIYLEKFNFRPSLLAKELKTFYATVKRLLCSAGLWDKAKIKLNGSGGRKRTTSIDKFGYKYADSQFDYVNDRGEVVRRYEHHVIAEQKYGRKLKECEVVHHVDLNKLNNDPSNLYICRDNKEHRLIHGQLERVAAQLIQNGIIVFDEQKGEYKLTRIQNDV